MMKFPSEDDFMEEFGVEPVEVDPGLALCRYVKKSKSDLLELDVSFSAVMKSFQAVLRLDAQELVVVSSEGVKSIGLFREGKEAGLHVVFELHGADSEARVIFEPDVSCRWWVLQKHGQ